MEHYKHNDLEDIKYFCEFDLIWKIEQWKDVVAYEEIYKISDLGRVKSLKRFVIRNNKNLYIPNDKILAKRHDRLGYSTVLLCKNGIMISRSVHQLEAEAFLGHISNGHVLEVNHKNFIRNDNRLDNLEIVTHRENCQKRKNKSGSIYLGVAFFKKTGRWRARSNISGKDTHLGYYKSELEAHKSVVEHEKQIKKYEAEKM